MAASEANAYGAEIAYANAMGEPGIAAQLEVLRDARIRRTVRPMTATGLFEFDEEMAALDVASLRAAVVGIHEPVNRRRWSSHGDGEANRGQPRTFLDEVIGRISGRPEPSRGDHRNHHRVGELGLAGLVASRASNSVRAAVDLARELDSNGEVDLQFLVGRWAAHGRSRLGSGAIQRTDNQFDPARLGGQRFAERRGSEGRGRPQSTTGRARRPESSPSPTGAGSALLLSRLVVLLTVVGPRPVRHQRIVEQGGAPEVRIVAELLSR